MTRSGRQRESLGRAGIGGRVAFAAVVRPLRECRMRRSTGSGSRRALVRVEATARRVPPELRFSKRIVADRIAVCRK
jgi:hypothetical protein